MYFDDCQWCGEPLPAPHPYGQHYHVGICQKAAYHEQRIAQNRRRYERIKYRKKHGRWKKDPMKRLHLDFALDRLKENKDHV
jgi:hypothetical protein